MIKQVRVFIGADENKLTADAYGSEGTPVLLLHGGGQTRHSWGGTAEKIVEAGMRAYCLDMRGHSDSEWVEDKYSFQDFGRDVVSVAEQIKKETGISPIAIGASLGGLASIIAEGAHAPGSLSGLILVDVTPRLDKGGVDKIVSFMAKNASDGFASVEEAAAVIAEYLPHRPKPKSLNGLAKNLRLKSDGRFYWHWDPRFIEQSNRDARHAEATQKALIDAAKQLQLPVLLVRGSTSELVNQDHVDEFIEMVPHAQFTEVKAAGHMVAGDKNDIFTASIMPFLSSVRMELDT
ncbi:alpha/beta hydrolase [Pseudovibrio sp. SPO723]|uniref:alpha/beta fold hydrolase n=1 Tax=Nesiotobacter zosterae TaxID=392721 RepID=UPI0029C5AC1E|nr:alpha/beta hydrolase [Pseudovibrio sp. SPO723]MDX5594623.1 alpha/beta hydrolase [Pseudovibrio sp. SPO723]